VQLDQRQLSHLLDVWPVGDFGVRQGYGLAWNVPMPTARELEPLGDPYRPYRKPKRTAFSNGCVRRYRRLGEPADAYDDDWDRLWWVRGRERGSRPNSTRHCCSGSLRAAR
jgi:hypothetical protein